MISLINTCIVISENHLHLFLMMHKVMCYKSFCAAWIWIQTHSYHHTVQHSSWNWTDYVDNHIITVSAASVNNVWLSCLHSLRKRLIAVIFPFSCSTSSCGYWSDGWNRFSPPDAVSVTRQKAQVVNVPHVYWAYLTNDSWCNEKSFSIYSTSVQARASPSVSSSKW